MKFSVLALGLLTATVRVMASNDGDDDLAKQKAAYFGSAEPDTELTKFEIDYVIDEYPDLEFSEVAHMWQSEVISVRHTISNMEDIDLTVVGLGGSFRDPITGDIKVNLTSNSVGPLVIEPGQTAEVIQKIDLNFDPGSYFLAPQVYVTFNEQLKVIQARAQLAIVKEVPISIFNPKLLFLEALFLVVICGFGYFFYASYLQTYFNKTASITKNTNASGKSSGFDPSWVPSHHQVTQKKTKTRKAY